MLCTESLYRLGPRRVVCDKDWTAAFWTVAEAKADLSEILRLAESEGPQRIGTRRSFVVVPADAWDDKANPRKPLGRWLIENMPRGIDLEVPERRSALEVPVSDEDA